MWLIYPGFEREMRKASGEGASLSWGLGGRAPFLWGLEC
jgi:hypothetical protein